MNKNQLGKNVYSSVNWSVDSSVGSSVGRSVYWSVDSSVLSSVWRPILSSVRGSVGVLFGVLLNKRPRRLLNE